MSVSKKQITKAGNLLLTSKSENEINIALDLINEWRSNHLLPLKYMKEKLVKICVTNKIEPVLISQRLKRLTSILYKLDLNIKMGLGGMQDIGGFRVILKDVKDLKKLDQILYDNSVPEFQKHKLERITNYVLSPKNSGYRSIHLIYKYHSSNPKYDGLRLELQMRTKLQHNWATAVETAGLITKTSLKSSKGLNDWLDFFKVVSSLFAIKENLNILEEHKKFTMSELMVLCYNYCKKLKIIEKLKALRVSIKHIESSKIDGAYYLLFIDLVNHKVNISLSKSNAKETVTKQYLEIEKTIKDDEGAVVLVSASSIKSLKKAYPSYFLDTSEFLTALETINKNCIKRQLI